MRDRVLSSAAPQLEATEVGVEEMTERVDDADYADVAFPLLCESGVGICDPGFGEPHGC